MYTALPGPRHQAYWDSWGHCPRGVMILRVLPVTTVGHTPPVRESKQRQQRAPDFWGP